MSEGNVPSRSHDADSLAAAQGQLPLQPDHPPLTDDWETVPLPGLSSLGSAEPVEQPSSSINSTPITVKEVELQSRIGDLNQCNEVLLSRVNQLEEALERSQQALQQEVERSQRLTEGEKVVAAQTRSVAQLLSELDDANAALKRQTLLAETLTAQLKTAEDRAQRFEQECTILRKRKVERARELQAAEDLCTDLRSRLQRQQQYTLQFKSALEKCLDTATFQHASRSIEIESGSSYGGSTVSEPTVTPAHSVGMPRSESIRPWSVNPAQIPADPQLQSLMRQTVAVEPSPNVEIPAQPTLLTPESPVDESEAESSTPMAAATPPAVERVAATNQEHEAEQQLWQDVERVIENTVTSNTAVPTKLETDATSATAPVTAAADSNESPPPPTEFTEPIPWGTPVKVTPSELPDPEPVSSNGPPSTTTADSETSPTSEPLHTGSQASELSRETAQAGAVFAAATARPATSMPALEAMQATQNSPSPLVHPLRPQQRKRKSLSAVELPSFPPLPKVPTE